MGAGKGAGPAHSQALPPLPIQKEDKFLVINRKFLVGLQDWEKEELHLLLCKLRQAIPAVGKHKYICCNRDEPYAEEVWQLILEGERKKAERQL